MSAAPPVNVIEIATRQRSGIWRELLRRPVGLMCLVTLGLLYFVALFAPILSPYEVSDQDLTRTYHPPTRLLWKNGGLWVQGYRLADPSEPLYVPDAAAAAPLHWWVDCPEYRWPWRSLGFPLRHRLFGVEKPARVYLLGSDTTGRDVFSRLIMGSRISLTIGIIAISISTFIAVIVGGLSGYFGGTFDAIAMRLTEIVMSIPDLYLIIALRGALSVYFTDSDTIYLMIVVIFAFISWAGTARVIRGLTLSLRQQTYIYAAEALGQRPWHILKDHLLPNLASYILVTGTLAIPGAILGEAALSFLGIGIQEPATSWGLMLSQAQDVKVFQTGFWWLLVPGLAITVVAVLFNILGNVLRDIVDPKLRTQV